MTTTAALRRDARACFAAAVAAADPVPLVAATLRRKAGALTLADDASVRHAGPVLVVAAGKAAMAMACGAAGVLEQARGVVVAPHGTPGVAPAGIVVHRAAHPLPDADGVAATAEVLRLVGSAGADTLVLVLLSGGASALLVAPADGVSLADKQAVTRALLAAGADIAALNAVRKHCSRVKGGGLARAAAGAAGCWTLALSDVVGDDPAVIGSGPTVADPTTFADARAALAGFLSRWEIPAGIRDRVEAGCAGHVPETPKPGDPALARTRMRVLAGNRTAVAAAASEARRRGYETTLLDAPLVGDAAAAGRMLAARLADLPADRPVALVAGGETTVRVVPGGRGGRAQHLALAAASALAGMPAALLACGTDGVDGPTDAAGACVDGTTAARAAAAGADLAAALARTDSHVALACTDDLVRSGPTGTNVADVVVAVRSAC